MTDAAGRTRTNALNADEIADAVWLAAQITAAGRQPDELPREPAPPTSQPPPPGSMPPTQPPWPIEEAPPTMRAPAPTTWMPPALVTAHPRRTPEDTAPRLSFVLPDVPEGLAKALRPLNQLAPSNRRHELDEEETAVAAAETGIWLPVHRPADEHRFELVLVVDRGASMRMWERTVHGFRALLERQGAFVDVKTISVDTDVKTVRSLESTPGTYCPPAQLADPTGRRLILVITDGVGPAWRSGSMFTLMSSWARTCHVAMVHLLPPERWSWTGVHVAPRTLRGHAPNITKAIPVLSLEPRYLRRWAELVSGANDVRLPVLTPPSTEDFEEKPEETSVTISPAEHLNRFRATATPHAVRLAGLLAGAPLNLRVMQAVQGSLLPESQHWHLAEVMLSGLIHRVPDDMPSLVEYEFRDGGLRRELLATVSRDDTAYVQRIVEDELGDEEPAVADLRYVLTDPDNATLPVVTSSSVSLLGVQREVLAALAGPYVRRANQVGELLNAYDASSNDPGATTTERLHSSSPKGASPEVVTSSRASEARARSIQPPPGTSVTTTSSETVKDVRAVGEPSPIWGGVPLRNVNFIGRTELLESLHSLLSKSTRTAVLPGALHGLGGIGKSQVAVEYIYRHSSEYDLIWWIPSENPSEIQASLVKLAKRLKLPVEQTIDTAVPAVIETLGMGEPYRRWLLVFDNAVNPEDVREFWPRRGEGHIIVTSRNGQWAAAAGTVEVDIFQRSESRELLQRRNADLADNDADRLAEVLGDLPLAVEQAAAWRAETGMSVDEYLGLFESKRTELLETGAPVDYDVAVEAAWNVSLDRLREENPGALELLEVCAFFSPEPISRQIFSAVRNIPVSAELEKTLADPIELGRAVREITRYSLAKIDHRTDTLQLHRLVQMVLRNKLTPDDQDRVRHTAHLLLANRDPKLPDSVENWPKYAELLPHVRTVDASNCTDRWVRRMAINVVNYLFAFGDPAGSLEMAQELATFWAEKLGEKHSDTLVASRWWGRTLRAIGRFEEGRAVSEKTLALLRETLGPTHEETLLTMHGVASDLRAKGDFRQAREMNEFAYNAALKRFGEDDPDTLAAANNYALSLRLVGDFAAAARLDEDTWNRKRLVLGDDHRHTLLTLDNWSVDLRETGQYLQARDRQIDTVLRMRKQLGDRHPMTLSGILNLAIAHRKAGGHLEKKSLRLAIEAADGLITKYGESHPDAMSAAMALSIEHRQDGNLIEARRLGEHVKGLYEATWGTHHPFSIAAATNVAVTLRLLGLIDQARELDEKALVDMREAVGENHPFTLVCATNYASDLAASNEFAAAYELDQGTFDRSVRELGENHPSTLALMVNLALDLRGLNRPDEAATMQLNAVTRLRDVLGPGHPATNDAQFDHRANCDIDPMQI